MKSFKFCFLVLGLAVSLLLSSCGGGGISTSTGTSGTDKTPDPAITSISPTKVTAGSGNVVLTVNGSNFDKSTVIQAGAITEPTEYVSSSQLTATISASQVASGSQLAIVAVSGSRSSASGAAINLEVDNPAPTIASVSPTVVLAKVSNQVIAVLGTGFVPTTVIQLNGTNRTTVFVSAMQVNVTFTDADVATSGSLSLTAVNPAPGGGTSTAATVSVTNPLPQITKLAPDSVLTTATQPVSITVTGANFTSNSVVRVNGADRTSTLVSSNQLTFSLTSADLASPALLAVNVFNPTPGGGTTATLTLQVLQPTSTPVITQVSPTSFVVGSSDQSITISGSNLGQSLGANRYALTSTVQWNGTPLTTGAGVLYTTPQSIVANVPASLLAVAGKASITVISSTSTPATSNAVQVSIDPPPPPTISSIYPKGGPAKTATTTDIRGTGFTSKSTVSLDGVTIPSTWVSSSEIKANVPASSMAIPGAMSLTVTTPAPGGGTTAPVDFTVYLGLAVNDMIYNAADSMLYASVPETTNGVDGNSIAVIDPLTGSVMREIWVGSKPNRLALSSDSTQLFVALDGASAVAQVNLATGKVVNQFQLGGGPGVYNPPYTATSLVAVPGSRNSVAVAAGGSVIIYDSGVARANKSSTTVGPLAFNTSGTTLYLWNGTLSALTVDSTGITGSKSLYSSSTYGYVNNGFIQYDNGRIYLPSGVAVDASTGALLGTFYSTSTSPASGPLVSDSTLGLAFIAVNPFVSTAQVMAFNESTFNPTSNIPVGSSDSSGFRKILRWGQNGLALNTNSQVFLFQSPVVKDLTATPADLSVSLSAPSSAKTGDTVSYKATITNGGPNSAEGTVLKLSLDSSLIVNSITPSQGTCSSGAVILCDVGELANGAQATVTVSTVPSTASTPVVTADVDSVSYDSVQTNDHATASVTVTGSLYAMLPVVTSISPLFVEAGSADFTLTVNGSGFNQNSTVNLGNSALTTTFVSATQLTASVASNNIATYGWAPITVTNASPGGGTSSVAPLTIYTFLDVQASSLTYDPFTQQLYAALPSSSTSLTGNSIVAVDPFAAKSGTPVLVGSEPNQIAETTDGRYLWVGLTGAKSLARFDLQQNSVAGTYPLSLPDYGGSVSVAATAIAAMPGSDNTLAIGTNGTWGTFGIFDVSGTTGSFRKNLSGIYSGTNPIFADATHVYAYDSQTSGAEFYRYTVDANGLNLVDGTTLNGMGGFGGLVKVANGLVYGASGGVANPLTTPPSQVALMSPVNFYPGGSASTVVALPDPSINREFMMIENTAGTWAYALARYNLSTYLPEAWIAMPNALNSVLNGWSMVRYGQDGIAFLATVTGQSNSQSKVQLMLVRGPFVTPQLLGVGTAATLNSASANAIAHGAGNTVITLTGSNFAPGTAVTWNGTYRSTTYVDNLHATVAIPASDLAATGTASVVATNPGAPASNSLTITIN